MKSLMTFIGILAFNFTPSSYASEFACPVSEGAKSYTCSGTVKVQNLTQLEAYKNNLGIVAKKPTVAKNLQIDFNADLSSDLIIATPCSIKITAGKTINSSSNVCLNGSKGVVVDANFHFTGKNLKIESYEEVVINEFAVVNAEDVRLLSLGLDDNSKAYLRNDAQINASNLLIESTNKGFVGKNSNVHLSGTLGIYSLGDDEASIREGARVEAQKIEVSSTEETRVANLTVLIANEIILNGQTCKINKGASITAATRLGNCFLSSLTKAKFSVDHNQGINPLTVNFYAGTITDAKGFIWSFGDGETINTLVPTVPHLYNRVGTFTATLMYATKENFKGLKSAGSIQIDIKAPPVVIPTTPPRGYFSYAQDGTFVYLKAFIRRTQFDIATAYYVIDDNQNNKIFISNFYQNSQSSVDMQTFGAHKVTMYVEDVEGQKYNSTLNIYLEQDEKKIAPFIRFYGEQSAIRTIFVNMSSSFIPAPDESLKSFTVDFGDGQTALVEDATSAVHTYAQAGTYNVTVSAKANGLTRSSTISVTLTDIDKPALRPVAAFDYHIFDFAGNVTFTDDRSGTPNGEILSYMWDFGDSTISYGKQASHFYLPGDYLVSLTIVDTAGLTSTSIQKIKIIDPGSDVVAGLGCSQEGIKEIICYIFALDKFTEITRVRIQWGDGTTENLSEAEILNWGLYLGKHTYQDYGTYTVRLTVNTARGETSYAYNSQTFVDLTSPIASIQCNANGLLVSCNGLASRDPGGDPLNYNFDFGNGHVDSNSTGITSYSYPQGGLYEVTLTVVNPSGGKGTNKLSIQITSLPIFANVQCITSGLLVNCSSLGSIYPNSLPISYIFNFGNGHLETNLTGVISYAYPEAGLYEVSLTVEDSSGAIGIGKTNVQVVKPANQLPIAKFICDSATPLTLYCKDDGSYDTDGTIAIRKLSFNDGTFEFVSQTDSVHHIFKTAGEHTLTYTVIDQDGGETVITKIFQIKLNTPPIASFECITPGPQILSCYSTSIEPDNGDLITVFDWEFGDGVIQSGFAGQFAHTYGENLVYTVKLTVHDQFGGSSIVQKDMTMVVNQAPVASINCLVTTGTTYNCNSNSSDPDGQIVESIWTIEGQDFTGNSILYDFTNGGERIIYFSVRDNLGKIISIKTTVLLSKPVAILVCNNTSNYKIKCDATSSVTAHGKGPSSYTISFEDDFVVDALIAEYEFQSSGVKIIKLEIQDNQGVKSYTETIVNILPRYTPPNPIFTEIVELGRVVVFDASLSLNQDRSVSRYEWSFGDGSSEVTTKPIIDHHFHENSFYKVILKVTDNSGITATFVKNIFIHDPQVLDPGERGRENLLGTDSDNDNIRDDVQRWIQQTSRGSTVTRKYLRTIASIYEENFRNINNLPNIINNFSKLNKLEQCSKLVEPDLAKNDMNNNIFRIAYGNTNERFLAMTTIDGSFAGQRIEEDMLDGELMSFCETVE